MIKTKRYWVRREECWGGTYVWTIRDAERSMSWRASVVGKSYRTESAAKRACEKANADFEKFLSRE